MAANVTEKKSAVSDGVTVYVINYPIPRININLVVRCNI